MKGLSITNRQNADVKQPEIIISKPQTQPTTTGKTAGDVISENFESIVNLASQYMEIKKGKVETDNQVKLLEQARKQLVTEAEVYCMKKDRETKDVVQRMMIIREMMNDFYAAAQQSQQPITSADFRIIITEIVNQMGRVGNGNQ